jgi:hypothetical protein
LLACGSGGAPTTIRRPDQPGAACGAMPATTPEPRHATCGRALRADTARHDPKACEDGQKVLECSSGLLTPSPPAEKSAAGYGQTGQSCASDGTWDANNSVCDTGTK